MGENDRVGERQGTVRAGRRGSERNAGDELTIIRLHSVARELDDGQCSTARQLSALRRVSISCKL